MTSRLSPASLRWVAMGAFVLCSAVNFLDRQLLAASAPAIKAEFHLSNAEYGQLLSAFAFTYTLAAPAVGWWMDRAGLNIGMTLAVGLWSLASVLTGFTRSFGALLGARALLGLGESAGMPGLAKANGLFLQPSEFAMSLAGNQVMISLGAMAAPLLVAAMAPGYGWRSVFVLCGLLGMLWIPLWMLASRRIPAAGAERVPVSPPPMSELLRDRRLWGLVASNALVMTVYSVWTNWTTIYLVQEHRLTSVVANQSFAWIPPIFATLGGFFGGWLALRWINGGMEVQRARMRSSWIAAVLLLVTGVVPWMPTPTLATTAISASFFSCMILQTNLHVMPLDIFGPGRAGFTVAFQASSYGLVQIALSPAIGAAVDRVGFGAVCTAMAGLPLIGMAILRVSLGAQKPSRIFMRVAAAAGPAK